MSLWVFLLTPVDTWDSYYFELFFRLVLFIKEFLIKKEFNSVLYSSEHCEITFPSKFIFVFIPYFAETILLKIFFVKSGGVGKEDIKGVAYRGGSNLLHTVTASSTTTIATRTTTRFCTDIIEVWWFSRIYIQNSC